MDMNTIKVTQKFSAMLNKPDLEADLSLLCSVRFKNEWRNTAIILWVFMVLTGTLLLRV
jgi:hypothetical protein